MSSNPSDITIGVIVVICLVFIFLTLGKPKASIKPVTMFTEETQEQKRTCHFLRCLYVAEDKLGMELVCSQTPAVCPPKERTDQ